MRKPPNLTGDQTIFPVKFTNVSPRLEIQVDLTTESNTVSTDFAGVQYYPKPQPDWAQNDPTALDYIKNKDIAEELRPIIVGGTEFLGKERSSGPVEFVSGDNVNLKTEENKVIIEAIIESWANKSEDEFIAWLLEVLPLGTGLKVIETLSNGETKKQLDVNEEIEFIWDAN